MNIEPRKPRTPFNFGHAVGAMFSTEDGPAFAWRLLFWTTAGITIVMLVTLPFILPFYGDLMAYNAQNMQAILSGGTPPNAEDLMPSMIKLIPISLIMMLGFWLAYAPGEAALHRKFLSGEENAKRPIRFGADERRVMVAQLGVYAMFFLVYIGGIVVMVAGAAIPVLGVVIAIAGFIALFVLIILVPIRLAPAAALSVLNKKQHLMAAKHVTKNRFWPLFGAYVVTFIGGYILIYFAMYIAIIMVTGDPNFILSMYGMGGEDPAQAFANAAARMKNPLVMILGVLAVVLYSLTYAFWLLSVAGVASYAVKWWRDDEVATQFT